MNTNEIIVHEMDRDRMSVVLDLFREGVCQPGKPPDRHPHREVLALNVRRADVLRIGVAGYVMRARPSAFGGL